MQTTGTSFWIWLIFKSFLYKNISGVRFYKYDLTSNYKKFPSHFNTIFVVQKQNNKNVPYIRLETLIFIHVFKTV